MAHICKHRIIALTSSKRPIFRIAPPPAAAESPAELSALQDLEWIPLEDLLAAYYNERGLAKFCEESSESKSGES